MAIDIELLRNVPIFHLLDDEELAELTSHIEETSFGTGETIFRASEPGGTMHVVLSGSVETFIMDEDGHRVVLAELHPGEMFGELSLFDGEPRSASAITKAPTRTFTVERGDLEQLFSRKPHAALDILAVLSGRLRRADLMVGQRVARNPNQVIEEAMSFGDRVSDAVARFGGSWSFINISMVLMFAWMGVNWWFMMHPFDPPPFIGLNLILSMIAALQAPIIMMSQNRQDEKDRVRTELDYQVNVRAEGGIVELHGKLDKMKEEMLETLARLESSGGRKEKG